MLGICTTKWALIIPYLSERKRPLRQESRGFSLNVCQMGSLSKEGNNSVATKDGRVPKNGEKSAEGGVDGRKGKHLERTQANLGKSTRICRTVSRVSQQVHIGRGPRVI